MKIPPTRKKTQAVQPQPYPYTIPPVPSLNAQDFAKLDPWYVTEFFRIEALLRSKRGMHLYQQDRASIQRRLAFLGKQWSDSRVIIDPRTDTLLGKFGVMFGWLVLDEAHHELLCPQTTEILGTTSSRSCKDLCKGVVYVDHFCLSSAREKAKEIQRAIDEVVYEIKTVLSRDRGRRFALLLLDSAFPPATILHQAKAILSKRHDSIKKQRWEGSHPFYPLHCAPNKRPLIKGFKSFQTWCDYIRCYDLRHNVLHGQTPPSFGRIATQVYGKSTSKTYERAEQGCKRVRRLIEDAENNRWPPSIR